MTAEEAEAASKRKAELEMLVDKKADKKRQKVVDTRFETKNNDFAIDPTHREYKKVV